MNTKLLWCVLLCAATMYALPAEETEASKALVQMKALTADWSGTFQWIGGRNESGSMNVTYYVTGNGSAVVENLIIESAPVMTSVYHLDGRDLRMTHFCGAQNQPRLKARSSVCRSDQPSDRNLERSYSLSEIALSHNA